MLRVFKQDAAVVQIKLTISYLVAVVLLTLVRLVLTLLEAEVVVVSEKVNQARQVVGLQVH
jgi:hypothetical protein